MSEKDISQEYNSIFDENDSSFVEEETMNRDYLQMIYNDDMDCLNKEIRMTRSQYFKEMMDIEEHYKKEEKAGKKRLLVFFLIFIGLSLIAVFFFLGWEHYKNIYTELTYQMNFKNLNVSGDVLRGYWAASGFCGCFAWISFVVGVFEFFFFGFGTIKTVRRIKKWKVKALAKLEERKKENMLAGTYDASK